MFSEPLQEKIWFKQNENKSEYCVDVFTNIVLMV